MRSGLALAAALVLLLAALAFKDCLIRVPLPPATSTAGQFDANRAVARLQRILEDQRPHPTDSAANAEVRARLIAEMQAIGLQPQVREGMTCNGFDRARWVGCANVRNIVATMGPSEGQHVVLSAHHDSTFVGPGAADDGIGVATLLESAAALRGRTLRRPVTFLINDGEEMGLIGARAFIERDPLAPRVAAMLNFEARGVTGPAIMFETSRPNGGAVAHYARSSDRPLANSLTADLYRLIPNDTDVSVYRERPWTILNFAIIGNETRYHSAGDTIAALDRRSVQHMGEQALAATLDLAAGPPAEASGERIYTDLLGLQLISLPLTFGLILLGLLLLFFLVETWRRRAFLRPLMSSAAAIVAATVLAWIGFTIVHLIRSGDFWRAHPVVTETAVYGSALAACLLAMILIGRDCDRTRLRPAFWLLFMLGGAVLSLVAPGGSIFFLLPPLAAALGMALERWRRGAERIGSIAAVLLLFLTFAPSLALFEVLMSNGPHWMFAPLGAAMLLPALIELRPLFARAGRAHALAAAVALFLLPWIAAALTPAYSDDHRQFFLIDYFWDADARRAQWVVNNDGAPLPYAGNWERAVPPYAIRPRWVAPAPAVAVPLPAVDLVGARPVQGGRRVQLRLHMNGAEQLALLAPAEAPVRAAGIAPDIRRIGGGAGRYSLRCIGPSCEGALFELVIGGSRPVEFLLLGITSGLPPEGASLVHQRPMASRPQYSPDERVAMRRLRL